MWDTEMVSLLRTMISDWDEPFTYTDERLRRLILMSAQFVSSDVSFTTTYTVSILEEILSPDLTDRDAGTRDDNFINLILLKSGCFIDQSEARTAASQAITIRDQGSMISLGGSGGVLSGKLALWQKGYCLAYQDARLNYLRGNGAVGIAVSGPLPGVTDPCRNGYR